ncbi:hypothetical protein [Mycobacterium sp. Aquia_213]|uniref:hypothetical protein n=1 Tax=Mycobacterium sp. Aquia_213 TaxID=2991728 RepID=UPI002271D72C|nr:hypothetical protein [Mycobacterium sp. Aquia_213]WAC90208.1 hypothetical protein LMQ14_20075 [Mycobacterium sp. Aquia_213]
MAFTTDEFLQLTRALTTWADATPDVPVLGFLQGGGMFLQDSELLTPHELLDAIGDPRNADGTAFLEMLEHAVRREGIESVTNRLYQSARYHENG